LPAVPPRSDSGGVVWLASSWKVGAVWGLHDDPRTVLIKGAIHEREKAPREAPQERRTVTTVARSGWAKRRENLPKLFFGEVFPNGLRILPARATSEASEATPVQRAQRAHLLK